MKAYFKKFNVSYLFVLLIVIMAIIRIIIQANLPSYIFLNAFHDDLLLINYSYLFDHFTNWNYLAMAKNISYSLFLAFVNFSGIPYNVWLGVVWVVSAFLVAYGIREFVTENRVILLFLFIFIAFLPVAFSTNVGLRIYRNVIMAPAVIIACMSMFIFVNRALDGIDRRVIVWAVVCGLAFSFYYYIKEDGILLLPIFCVMIFAIAVYGLYKAELNRKNYRNIIKVLVVSLLPLIIFGLVTVAYEQTNNHYFGVSEINARTNGEFGTFWHNLLLIDDDNKNTTIWVPYSTIEKAWNNSPTLQSHPDLLNAIRSSTWGEYSIPNSTLPGDLVSWSLLDTLYRTDYYSNEQEIQDLFRPVNNELEDAFSNGNLKKSDKLFISSSLPGYDSDEIDKVYSVFALGLNANMLYHNITMDPLPILGSSHMMRDAFIDELEIVLNQELPISDNLTSSQKFSLQFGEFDIEAYQLLAPIFVLLSFLGFVLIVVKEIKTKFKDARLNLLLIFEIMMFGTFIVQVFAISWFDIWMDVWDSAIVFYTVSCHGLFALFEALAIAFGMGLLYDKFKDKF